MLRSAPRRFAALLLLPVLLAWAGLACSASTKAEPTATSAVEVATVAQPTATAVVVTATPSATSTSAPPASTSTSTSAPASTSTPSTPPSVGPCLADCGPGAATPTPASTGPISYKPSQLIQGGVAVIYLNAPASAATLRFGGQSYPMLQDGSRWWAIVGVGAFASPGSAPISITYTPQGQTAPASVSDSIQIVTHDYGSENIDLDPDATALLAQDIVDAETAFRAQLYDGYTMPRLWSGPFVRPSQAAIGDIYGIARGYNGAPVSSYHTGNDFIAQTGDPVVAAAAGRVVFAGALQVRGNSVIIDHGAGVFTAYHHFSEIDVAQGAMVTPGQFIGRVGATGLVTGPHLHWEVIIRGVEVDGRLFLQGNEIGP